MRGVPLARRCAIDDAQFGAWVRASGAAGVRVRLPVALVPDARGASSLQRRGTVGPFAFDLDDAGLGATLEDAVQERWSTAQPAYELWLTGVWDADDNTFVVIEVGPPVDLRERTAGLVASHEVATP